MVKDRVKIGSRNKTEKGRSEEGNEGRRTEIFEREMYVEVTAGAMKTVMVAV